MAERVCPPLKQWCAWDPKVLIYELPVVQAIPGRARGATRRVL